VQREGGQEQPYVSPQQGELVGFFHLPCVWLSSLSPDACSPGKATASVVPKQASLFNTAQPVGRRLGARKDSTHPRQPVRHLGGVSLFIAALPSFKATLFTFQSGCRGGGLAGTLWLMVPSGQETKDGGGKQG